MKEKKAPPIPIHIIANIFSPTVIDGTSPNPTVVNVCKDQTTDVRYCYDGSEFS